MALSQKALDRQIKVSQYIQDQVREPRLLLIAPSNDRGKVTLARLWMLGGLALSAPFPPANEHIFENDELWKYVARELKISSGIFYRHADVEAWSPLMAETHVLSMRKVFHRSQFYRHTIMTLIRPLAVRGFPVFEASTYRTGLTTGDYPQDEVLHWLGLVGGTVHPEDRTLGGELGMSNDTSLSALTVSIGELDVSVHESSLTDTSFRVSYNGGDATVTIKATPTALTTHVETESSAFVDGEGNVIVTCKLIAEDDSEKTYTLTIVDT